MTEPGTALNQDAPIPQDVRRMFERMLAGWAMDSLALRRSGLDRPSLRSSERPASPLAKAA